MNIWTYYTRLAITDLFRLWSSTQHHVIIVAGICLPILLLLGLGAGQVAKMREKIETNPTARLVVFYSAQSDTFITSEFADELMQRSPEVDLVIPESQRSVTIGRKIAGKDPGPAESLEITVYPTRPGDPQLGRLNCDVLEADGRGIVLAKVVADQLGVVKDETISMIVRRERGSLLESASVELKVKAIAAFGSDQKNFGFLPSPMLSRIETYVRGYKVEELGWPAMKAAVRDRYASYLVIYQGQTVNPPSDVTKTTRENFEAIDFSLREVKEPQVKNLFGLIKPESAGKLRIYEAYTTNSREEYKHRISMAPTDLKINLVDEGDPVILAWNKPSQLKLDQRQLTTLGVSVAQRTWFRKHLVDTNAAFAFDAKSNSVALVRDGKTVSVPKGAIVLALADGTSFQVQGFTHDYRKKSGNSKESANKKTGAKQKSAATKDPPSTEVLVVPADLLAQLDAYLNKRATYDQQTNLFVPVAEAIHFEKARVYANNIDSIPTIVEELRALGGVTESFEGLISEMHESADDLRLLVGVVGVGVFLFGVITVFSVLLDSTDRKRGAIGILRVMGVSRSGIFFVVILRAVLIGLFAGLLTIVVGYLVAWWASTITDPATGEKEVDILVLLPDVMTVFCGALLVAAVGAVVPAFRASRMDPFEAIVEGRFR